jgi:rRNA maturation protein Nop10
MPYILRFGHAGDAKPASSYLIKSLGRKSEVVGMKDEVLRWVCPRCGKQILSLYPRQFSANISVHRRFCTEKFIKETKELIKRRAKIESGVTGK